MMRKVKCLKCKHCLRTNYPDQYICSKIYPGFASVFREGYAKAKHKCRWFSKMDIKKEEKAK